MGLGHHILSENDCYFKRSFKNIQNTNGTARLLCQILKGFLSKVPQRAWHLIQNHLGCYGMKSWRNFLKQW